MGNVVDSIDPPGARAWVEIVCVLDEGGCTDEEAERAMRRVRELFKHVMEKMGFVVNWNKLVRECKYFDEDFEHFGGDEAPKGNCTHPRNNPCPKGFEGTCCARCLEEQLSSVTCAYKCS